jgi:hypothetical protein
MGRIISILRLGGCPGFEPRPFRLRILNFECVTIRRYGEGSTPDVGIRAVPRFCIILGPGICLTTEEKSRKNLSHQRLLLVFL